MTKEDKELLLKDLCARLPYGVICRNVRNNFDISDFNHNAEGIKVLINEYNIKPYLRPMSSMTKEERYVYYSYCDYYYGKHFDTVESIDWLNKKMFDYRKDDEGKTMIEKGIALVAPEGMYK